jgi:Ca2+-binding EF-hand superfamily protein
LIAFFSTVDSDTGKLDFDGFCEVMSKYRKNLADVEAELLQAFLVFDKNGDSTIDASELREVNRLLQIYVLHKLQVYVLYKFAMRFASCVGICLATAD